MSRRPHPFRSTLAALACAAALLAPLPAVGDTCVGLDLAALTPAPAGTAPSAVAAGDFNHDGRLDVAVANSGSNDVSILLGNGLGGFTPGPASPISAGATSNPTDIAVGDLDGDGFLDLVVAFGTLAQAKVLRGLPGGGFDGTIAPLPLNAIPTRVYLADFNRDADLDLVVISDGGQRILLYGGATGTSFGGAALADVSLFGAPGERPAAAAVLDFNRDGRPDLAVATAENSTTIGLVRVYIGNGSGGLAAGPSAGLGTGAAAKDIAAGDVNRDGWLDLVTANSGTATASVVLNTGGASLTPQPSVAVGGVPLRVALVDLDHDAVLDLAALDDSPTPRVSAFRGLKAGPPHFDPSPAAANLTGLTNVRGLAVGRLTSDGRSDLVTSVGSSSQAVAIENRSGTPCAGTSFARAPRGYAAGDGPSSTAAADLDGDGRADLAVAAQNSKKLWLLQNAGGHFKEFLPSTAVDVAPATPTAVASADFDGDGKPDVVAALSSPDMVQVFLGDGTGGLLPGAFASIGANPSALAIGDFDGNGIPDVAATSETANSVYIYRGDGFGGFLAPVLQTTVGAGPRALVAGFFDAGPTLDLAVANAAANSVSVLLGIGDGTFTPAAGSPVALGPATTPWGIAAGDVDGDTDVDLVTADFGNGTVSLLRNDGALGFSLQASYPVRPNPTAVALLDLGGDSALDLVVTSAGTTGDRVLAVLINTGGVFGSPSEYPVRNFPRAITPVDVDADGRLDLVVPCQTADSVAVLLARPPGPPPLLEAARVAVGANPRALVSADIDGDGDLDLAVAATGANEVTLKQNDGNGGFSAFATPSYVVGAAPESIVAADFNRDGRIDLALNGPGATPDPVVSILLAAGAPGQFTPQSFLLPGMKPDDIAVGDFDQDGDDDMAVCDKQTIGAVQILRNDGSGTFALGPYILRPLGVAIGDEPTAIVAVDVDGDSYPDLAVANEKSDDVVVLLNDRAGGFTVGPPLPLEAPDTGPVSIAAGDLDGDGAPELVAAAGAFGDRVHVFRNLGGGTFGASVPVPAPVQPRFVTVADLNRDGELDVATVAAGLVALRGGLALNFEPPEIWLAGVNPFAVSIADFNRDGRPDSAVANAGSNDVSVLLSSTCMARRLDVAQQPLACGASPYDVVVEARDDGGNLAVCATGAVKPAIVPGTGEPGAVLGPPAIVASGLTLAGGIASFTGPNRLTIDRPGRRYRLQFSLEDTPPPNLPLALSRSFTFGASTIEILGPASFCAPGSASYGIVDPPGHWDSYFWKFDGAPFAFTPTVLLANPGNPLVTSGPHTLALTTQLDTCSATAPIRDVYVGDLQSVILDPPAVVSSVCVDCIGGTKKAVETGGGPVTRQWGYRTASGTPPIIDLPGETGETYTLKGASFPGPGTYYVVVTSTSACAPTQRTSNEWPVTVEAGGGTGEVLHLAASSRGGPGLTTGENKLLWVNTTAPLEVLIRWNKADDGTTACVPPSSPTSPPNNPPATSETSIMPVVANAKDSYLHSGLVINTAYCYSVFVRTGTGWSPGRTVKARPFDATTRPGSSVKWAYATGGTAVAPPTVSGPAVLAMSNDHTVHALTRGVAGGDWPASWMPYALAGVAHSRSPVVPFTPPLGTSDNVLFAADDAVTGLAHAIDARTGLSLAGWPEPQGVPITGAPGGMFALYGGVRDTIFVGTRGAADNQLRALDLTTGTLLEAYGPLGAPGPIGPILGSPAIDYNTRRLYFASWKQGGGNTLFCLQIKPSPPSAPVFETAPCWYRDLGNITGSPVLVDDRVIVGTDGGDIYSINAATGDQLDDHVYATLDGPVKGFLFPDRRGDDLIFATTTKVWSLSDVGPTMTVNWTWTQPGLNPSIVLYRPRTNFVYVGSKNGEIYELDFTSATPVLAPTHLLQVLGGGQGQVGAPSLDISRDLGPPEMLLVGSEPGVVYALELPFPPP